MIMLTVQILYQAWIGSAAHMIHHIPGGLVIMGVLSLTPVTVTEIVAVPVCGGAASSTAITWKRKLM